MQTWVETVVLDGYEGCGGSGGGGSVGSVSGDDITVFSDTIIRPCSFFSPAKIS